MADYARIILAVLQIIYYWIESIVLFFIPRHLYLKDVKDDIILITGAGSGIGRLLALKFSAIGAKVILWDINKESNDETAKLIKKQGGIAYPFVIDITNRELVYATAEKIKETIGKVTILINNAGIVNGTPLIETPDDKIVKTFNINIMSHFWTIKAFLPDMMAANHGHVVCMSSIAGIVGSVRLADYCATKFATLGLQESLDLELMALGCDQVHTTSICPLFISTGMFEGADPGVFPFLKPEEVAERIVTGIRNNQTVVYIPRSIYPLYTLKTMMPWKAFRVLYCLLGADSSMKDFVGRQGNPKIK